MKYLPFLALVLVSCGNPIIPSYSKYDEFQMGQNLSLVKEIKLKDYFLSEDFDTSENRYPAYIPLIGSQGESSQGILVLPYVESDKDYIPRLKLWAVIAPDLALSTQVSQAAQGDFFTSHGFFPYYTGVQPSKFSSPEPNFALFFSNQEAMVHGYLETESWPQDTGKLLYLVQALSALPKLPTDQNPDSQPSMPQWYNAPIPETADNYVSASWRSFLVGGLAVSGFYRGNSFKDPMSFNQVYQWGFIRNESTWNSSTSSIDLVKTTTNFYQQSNTSPTLMNLVRYGSRLFPMLDTMGNLDETTSLVQGSQPDGTLERYSLTGTPFDPMLAGSGSINVTSSETHPRAIVWALNGEVVLDSDSGGYYLPKQANRRIAPGGFRFLQGAFDKDGGLWFIFTQVLNQPGLRQCVIRTWAYKYQP